MAVPQPDDGTGDLPRGVARGLDPYGHPMKLPAGGLHAEIRVLDWLTGVDRLSPVVQPSEVLLVDEVPGLGANQHTRGPTEHVERRRRNPANIAAAVGLKDDVRRVLRQQAELLAQFDPVGHVAPGVTQPVARLDRANVTVPFGAQDLVEIREVVEEQGLAGLYGVDVRLEDTRTEMSGEEVKEAGTDHYFACRVVIGNGRFVRVGEDEVNNDAVGVAHGLEDHERIHQGVAGGVQAGTLERQLLQKFLGVPATRRPRRIVSLRGVGLEIPACAMTLQHAASDLTPSEFRWVIHQRRTDTPFAETPSSTVAAKLSARVSQQSKTLDATAYAVTVLVAWTESRFPRGHDGEVGDSRFRSSGGTFSGATQEVARDLRDVRCLVVTWRRSSSCS